MIDRLRWLSTKIFTPVAALLLKLKVSPDAVTIAGTVATMAAALWLYPTGHLFAGSLVISILVLSDVIDGTMARMLGRSGPWGAFLDSTLDRLADAAVFTGLGIYLLRGTSFGIDDRLATTGVVVAFACLALGAVVPYARARAEGLGMTAQVGIAERGDRLVVTLLAAGIVGLGVPAVVLVVVLGLLAVASAITVLQRMMVVRRQALAIAAADETPVTEQE